MKKTISILIFLFVGSFLFSQCAKDVCPGESKYQYAMKLKVKAKSSRKKPKPSMIQVSRNYKRR